jgi:hypothetical protein
MGHVANSTPVAPRNKLASQSATRINDTSSLGGGGNPYSGMQRERKGCSCKNSKCLKLYCECFAKAAYCGPHCHCANCRNNQDNDAETIWHIIEKNPDAFRTKITNRVG